MHASQRIIALIKLRNPITSHASLKRSGLYFATITAILFILSLLINRGGAMNISPALPIMMIFITIYAIEHDFFPQLKNEMESILYLTLPADNWEKWLAECIQTLIIFPIKSITPIVLSIAIIIMMSSREITFDIGSLWKTIGFYWISHPLIFFGAAYFKKSVNAKLAATTVFVIVFSIFVTFCTLYFLASNGNLDFQQKMALENTAVNFNLAGPNTFLSVLTAAVYIAFFWGLSYVSLVEVEK